MPITPLRPGDPAVIGPHRLLGRLGQGGMGTVFLAVSPDERAVAVKVLRDPVGDAEARRRFRQELAALRRVRGPHLVEVLDADVDADTPYLVTRFVPGRRLDELVSVEGPLEGGPLRTVARGVADALTTLHRADIVHRDLTPANVLVLDGSPQVIDLGLATAADVAAMTRSGLVVGTPGYLAPEQVTGRPVTAATDVHAWGATVALAGTGRPPYGTGRPEAVLYRTVHGEPDLDGLPTDLRELVEAAMSAEPTRRPRAAELLAELGGASAAETTVISLPRDVDATTLLATDALHPRPTAVLTAVGDRGLVPARYGHDGDGDGDPVASDDVIPWPDEPPAPRPSTARSMQVLVTAAAALAVVATAALVAPVVAGALTLVLLVLLRTASRSSDRLALRRERRGERRRDPFVAVFGAPWHLLAALLDTVVSLPLLVVSAAVPAGAVYLLDPTFNGLEGPELTAATATVVATVVWLARRGNRRSRRALRDGLVTATPSAAGGVAVVTVLLVSAVLLLAAAEGTAPIWWPLETLR